ncbi:TRAM domain-containing protein [Halostella sp. JP-L12]|uniref:TRAM domain-containing protein n=1 Tax=Halostella TaxID=1843185 RepID=UPI000EF7C4BA|nr:MULTISPECIES: TRAM domain-containing protein [Halostella]NHN47786.1 TRAM domain-containing protein [Halostella sp. JP-L12]
MEISNDILCLFSAEIEETRDSYVIEVPKREIDVGDVDENGAYRVALLAAASAGQDRSSPAREQRTEASATSPAPDRKSSGSTPPVTEGEQRTVEIEDIGEQGDGIARVDQGYVIIVPDTELRERVTIEITDVAETVAFGEVVERGEYYD